MEAHDSTGSIRASALSDAVAPALPFLDLKAQFATIREEILRAVEAVLESQQFILGHEVQQFEREIADSLRVPYAISCASGSDALYLSLCAQHIGPGDEVLTTPFTFGATATAIARTGARPVFVDIRRDTFNLDPDRLERAITRRTRAVIPVHLFGLPAALEPILEIARARRLVVVEDAAQAIGATYKGRPVGGIGDFGCFSFFPSKNLGGAGDGGLVTTRDPTKAERLRLLRVHGSRRKYHYETLGMNSRLDALQAAILRVKLPYLEFWQRARQRRAGLYLRLFAEHRLCETVCLPRVPPNCSHVFNQFVIRCRDRDRLRAHLLERGIPTEIYYPRPLHLQPAFSRLGYSPGSFPEAEACCEEVLALPIYPELGDEDQERIVAAIADFYRSRL